MVKRLFLLSLMVLALCGASTVVTLAGGPPGAAGYMPPPPCIPAENARARISLRELGADFRLAQTALLPNCAGPQFRLHGRGGMSSAQGRR